MVPNLVSDCPAKIGFQSYDTDYVLNMTLDLGMKTARGRSKGRWAPKKERAFLKVDSPLAPNLASDRPVKLVFLLRRGGLVERQGARRLIDCRVPSGKLLANS